MTETQIIINPWVSYSPYMLGLIECSPYAWIQHKAFFIVRTKCRSTRQAVQKYLEPRRHSTKKGHLRRQAINLIPPVMVKTLVGRPSWGALVSAARRKCWVSLAPVSGSLNRLPTKPRRMRPDLCTSEYGKPKCIPAQWASYTSKKKQYRHYILPMKMANPNGNGWGIRITGLDVMIGSCFYIGNTREPLCMLF